MSKYILLLLFGIVTQLFLYLAQTLMSAVLALATGMPLALIPTATSAVHATLDSVEMEFHAKVKFSSTFC